MTPFRKSVVSLRFKTKLPQTSLLLFSKNVQTRISTDVQFASIAAIATGELAPANTTFEQKLEQAVGGGVEATALKDKAMGAVLVILNKLAQEVNIIANGDESVILAAGFEVRKSGERTEDDPNPVTDLVVKTTLVEGTVKCVWTKAELANKTAFEWEDPEVPAVWHNGDYADGSKLLMKGLPSKKWVNVRARSLATGNRKSPWCTPVPVFVL